jgi:hypothetical protein
MKVKDKNHIHDEIAEELITLGNREFCLVGHNAMQFTESQVMF